MRLAPSDPDCYGPDYHCPQLPGLHSQVLRRRPNAASNNRCCCLSKSRSCDSYASFDSSSSSSSPSSSPTASQFSHKPPKPGALQVGYLFAQQTAQCFHSLPSKLQQRFFSPEERAYLRQTYRESVILDAADQAVYRLDRLNKELARPSFETLPFETTTTHNSQTSTLYFESSDSDSGSDSEWDTDPESDDDEMDASLYDRLRGLDDNKNLDLSLDEYHSHVVNTVPKLPPRSKPSFRRTMSFSPANRARKTTSISHTKAPSSSQSSNVPSSLAHIVGRHSTSRPPSGQQRSPLHLPHSSTSNIDPTAQYYQDPEARLKLRVYLASPQKFDEAVEFGFPSMGDNKDNNYPHPECPEKIPECPIPPKVQRVTGTFFEDQNGAVHGDRNDKAPRRTSRLSKAPPNTQNPNAKRQSRAPSQSGPRRGPGNREMTLKMTLTRPDLRTDSPSTSPTSAEDPLKLEELSAVDNSHEIWESDPDQQNVMKKMWRKIRKQK